MTEPIDELRIQPEPDAHVSERRVRRIVRRVRVETASGDALTFVLLRVWKALVVVGAVATAVLGRRAANPHQSPIHDPHDASTSAPRDGPPEGRKEEP